MTSPPSTVTKPLSEFLDLDVEVFRHTTQTNPDTRRHTVTLVYHLTEGLPQELECFAVGSDLAVTLAGVSATLHRSGGFEPVEAPDGTHNICMPPIFLAELPVSVTGPTKVRLVDASLDVTFDVTLPGN